MEERDRRTRDWGEQEDGGEGAARKILRRGREVTKHGTDSPTYRIVV